VRRLSYGAAAQRDLRAIARYIARESGSPDTAKRFVGQLRQQCEKLASLPGTLGRPRPELHADLRSSPFRGYVIFFRYVDDLVEIVNVLEGHRDIDSFFGREQN
jgi:toxin ParE1/3/4